MDVHIFREKSGIDDIAIYKHNDRDDRDAQEHFDIVAGGNAHDHSRCVADDRAKIRNQVTKAHANADQDCIRNARNRERYRRKHADNRRIHHLPAYIAGKGVICVFHKDDELISVLFSKEKAERTSPIRNNTVLFIQQEIDGENDAEQKA